MTEQCEAVQPWLSAYLDEELDARRQSEVQAHLASCDACRRELAALRQTAQAMHAWCVPAVNPQLSVAFAERLHARHPQRARWRELLSAAQPRLAWLAGGALLLVLLLGIHFLPRQDRLLTAKNYTNAPQQLPVSQTHDTVLPRRANSGTLQPGRVGNGTPRPRHIDNGMARPGQVHKQRRNHTRKYEGAPAPTHERAPVLAKVPAPKPGKSAAVAAPASAEINDLAIALITETPAPDSGQGTDSGTSPNELGTHRVTSGEGAHLNNSGGTPTLVEVSTDESPERVLLAYMTETN